MLETGRVDYGDGKILLSGEGSILDFSVSLEKLLTMPSMEIYGKPIGDFVEFQGFEGKANAIVYGDSLRFESQLSLNHPPERVLRTGWIKSKHHIESVRLETSMAVVNGRTCVNLHYWRVASGSSIHLVPEGLPTFWGPIAKLCLNLWQNERSFLLFALVIIFLGGVVYYTKHVPPQPSIVKPTVKVINATPTKN